MTDTSGTNLTTFLIELPAAMLMITPIAIGASTIFRISARSAPALTGMRVPANKRKMNGVNTGASTVLTPETVSDSAVSPLAMNVMTFEAAPLGRHPTRIRPAANDGGKLRTLEMEKATSGMIR